MDWRRPGDKLLSEPVLAKATEAYMMNEPWSKMSFVLLKHIKLIASDTSKRVILNAVISGIHVIKTCISWNDDASVECNHMDSIIWNVAGLD